MWEPKPSLLCIEYKYHAWSWWGRKQSKSSTTSRQNSKTHKQKREKTEANILKVQKNNKHHSTKRQRKQKESNTERTRALGYSAFCQWFFRLFLVCPLVYLVSVMLHFLVILFGAAFLEMQWLTKNKSFKWFSLLAIESSLHLVSPSHCSAAALALKHPKREAKKPGPQFIQGRCQCHLSFF